jgi:hypothetical protein
MEVEPSPVPSQLVGGFVVPVEHPSLPQPMVTSTQENKSLKQPLGLSAVANFALQSACCHIWKKRCTGLLA